jgi:hypothetical protein
MDQVGFKEGSGASEEWVLVKPGFISHDEYMRLLARSAFALSPPGTWHIYIYRQKYREI